MSFFLPLSIIAEIKTEFRIIKRIILETLKGINRTGLMNLVIISTMAAILSIFGCLFRTSQGINSFVEQLGSTLKISVYLTKDANVNQITKEVYKIGNIKSVNIITKEQAWEDLKKQMNVPDIQNPLMDTLHVKVKNQNSMDQISNRIKKIKGVEGVQYARQLAEKIQKVGDITGIATIIILLLLGSLTLFIISNTIQLVIQARRQEIEIMRMMGVSNWFIRAPYILQGAFYGLCGSLISLIPLYILQSNLIKLFNFFQISTSAANTNLVVFTLLMMGIIVGAGGSIISVRKYLHV